MLTFIPMYADDEPVVRPPKKGEWCIVNHGTMMLCEWDGNTIACPIYRAVDSADRLVAERALVAACQEADMLYAHGVGGTMCVSSNQSMRDNGNRNIEEARTILAKIKFALAAALTAGIGGES